jgi:hypothetical protein
MPLPFRVRCASENRVVIGSFTYQPGQMPLEVWDLPSAGSMQSDRIIG